MEDEGAVASKKNTEAKQQQMSKEQKQSEPEIPSRVVNKTSPVKPELPEMEESVTELPVKCERMDTTPAVASLSCDPSEKIEINQKTKLRDTVDDAKPDNTMDVEVPDLPASTGSDKEEALATDIPTEPMLEGAIPEKSNTEANSNLLKQVVSKSQDLAPDVPKASTAESVSVSLQSGIPSPPIVSVSQTQSGDDPANTVPKKDAQKVIKSEAIAEAARFAADPQSSLGEPSASETKAESSSTSGDVIKRVSPRLQILAAAENVAKEDQVAVSEKMDVDITPMVPSLRTTPDKLSAPRSSSTSPRLAGDSKPATKHPPIAGKTMKRERRKSSNSSPTIPGGEPRKIRTKSATSPGGKLKKKPPPSKDDSQDARNDFYCWVCHKEGEVLCCELCPRVFHVKCLNMAEEPEGDWFCPECEKITVAECKETQSRAMAMLTTDQFSLLLKQVIQRMKIPSSEPFHEPVDTNMFPDYLDYIFHPMDLSTIEKNVKRRKYGCPEAFLSEFKWVVHNCILYNGFQSKLTQSAKAMLKVAERELNEIEVCPECYRNSCRKRDNWFCEPCSELHPLVWAKLQGFPHWPAKALRIDKGMVDVRFFGQHDRAWIPLAACYLISKELPLPVKNKKKNKGPGLRGGLDFAMQEMQGYIDNIKKITGEFEYAPLRTLLTHCDLYRKTASVKAAQSIGTQESADGSAKEMEKTDTMDIKAKVELRDIGAVSKDLVRSRIVASTTQKKTKTVTTGGEHPTRSFATKKKKASFPFLSKTIESCKASLGIEKIQDVKMNSGSEESTSSSDEEENAGEDWKEQTTEQSEESSSKEVVVSTAVTKPNVDEDDSDAELVIDLGEVDESADPSASGKTALKVGDGAVVNTGEAVRKKHKDAVTTDKPSTSKPPIKSILLNAPKPLDKDEKKKMLAKALSERIGSKRKHESEAPSSSLAAKVRKTVEQPEKRGASPSDVGKRTQKLKDKECKKSQFAGKHTEKESSVKMKPGILKPLVDPTGQRRGDNHPGEKRVLDPSKQRPKDQKDGAQKSILKKPVSGKLGRIQVPTEADTKKLFNGGRIPRKNPAVSTSDDEQEHRSQQEENSPAVDTNQIARGRGAGDPGSNPMFNSPRKTVASKQIATAEQQKIPAEENTFASLKKYSDKVIETVQKVFYEMYADMMVPLTAGARSVASTAASATAMHDVAQMRLELERLKWLHKQEIAELKHNRDLTIAEIRQSLEFEKNQLLIEAKAKADAAREQAVEETKRKQWCASCNKEAIFYCCWNTSYCDYPCQQKHWPEHMDSCTQARESSAQTGPVMETVTSSPMQHTSASQPTNTSVGGLSHPAKTLTIASSATLTKKILTISASLGNIPRLSSSSEKTASAVPASVMASSTRVTSAGKTQAKVTVLPQKSTLAPAAILKQQKSGSAISAIGARLMAARQRSDEPGRKSPSTKSPSSHLSLETAPAASTDHIKAVMESPLSPDANPPSPSKAPETKLSRITPQEGRKDEKQSHVPKDETEPAKMKSEGGAKSPKVEASVADGSASRSLPVAPGVTEPSVPMTTSKLVTLPVKAVFSSPSAVAALIAEMGTPLSSNFSSPGTPSASETPEKKANVVDPAKVQLSFAGSAFTKVVREGERPAVQERSKAMVGASETQAAAERAPVSKPETSTPAATAKAKNLETVPVVAPAIADSYLTSLHKTLPPKSKKTSAPVAEEVAHDVPMKGLPRPTLPESDEDKSVLSESKITDSDAGEPMETDGTK